MNNIDDYDINTNIDHGIMINNKYSYCILPIEIPYFTNEKIIKFTYINENNISNPIIFGIKMMKCSSMSYYQFKQKISKKFNVPSNQLYVCTIHQSRIRSCYESNVNTFCCNYVDMHSISISKQSDSDIFVYHLKHANSKIFQVIHLIQIRVIYLVTIC